MSKGWICLHREIMDKASSKLQLLNKPFGNPSMMANHTRRNGSGKQKFICEPGNLLPVLSIARKSGKMFQSRMFELR